MDEPLLSVIAFSNTYEAPTEHSLKLNAQGHPVCQSDDTLTTYLMIARKVPDSRSGQHSPSLLNPIFVRLRKQHIKLS